jgi:transcriptional regulator with XRE-family HTH domain
MKLGDLIREYREKHDLSQRQFALGCGLSNGYISMLEKGKNPKTGKPVTPTLFQLKKLADGMNITIMELLERIDDIPIDISTDLISNKKNFAPTNESEKIDLLDIEIANIILQLSPEKKIEAINYLSYLAERKNN